MDHKNLKIFLDCSGKTFEYNLINDDGEVMLMGDGYESADEIIEELSLWNNALKQVFG